MSRQQIPKVHRAASERILPSLGGSLRAPLSFISFWSAIALPALYLPFAATGIETTTGL